MTTVLVVDVDVSSDAGSGRSAIERSLPMPDVDDVESLRGRTRAEVAAAAQASGWHLRGRSRDGNGDVWVHPTKRGEQVIINDGYPGARDPLHAGPYVKVSRNSTRRRVPLSKE